MRRLRLALPLCLALAACHAAGPTSGLSSDSLPTPPPPKFLCPATAKAIPDAEPVPPAGIDAATLHALLIIAFPTAGDDFYQWAMVTHPTWARSVARQAEQGARDCIALEARH